MSSGPGDARPELRIGDRERDQAVAHLGTAFGEGRLELAEYDERVAAAYSAKTASDLLQLTADLPLATREVGAAGAVSDTAPATPSLRSSRPARSSGAEFLSGLPGPLRAAWWAYAAAVSISLVVWLIVGVGGDGEIAYPWPIWVAGPWGVILLFSTLAYRSGPGPRRR